MAEEIREIEQRFLELPTIEGVVGFQKEGRWLIQAGDVLGMETKKDRTLLLFSDLLVWASSAKKNKLKLEGYFYNRKCLCTSMKDTSWEDMHCFMVVNDDGTEIRNEARSPDEKKMWLRAIQSAFKRADKDFKEEEKLKMERAKEYVNSMKDSWDSTGSISPRILTENKDA